MDVARKIGNRILILLAATILAFAACMWWLRSLGDPLELEDRALGARLLPAPLAAGTPS